jgi:hypothetical protein
MKWILFGSVAGAGYLWWKGGGLSASDPLAAVSAGWHSVFACNGCGGGTTGTLGGKPTGTQNAGPMPIQVGAAA